MLLYDVMQCNVYESDITQTCQQTNETQSDFRIIITICGAAGVQHQMLLTHSGSAVPARGRSLPQQMWFRFATVLNKPWGKP